MQVQALTESEALINPDIESLQFLIVDDEPAICETLQHFFRHIGFNNIHTADSGEKALEYIDKARYDFIFLDLMLPQMHGLDVLRVIQESQLLTSVIIMTGYPSMEVVIDAMHHGAADFLIKPFQFQDVKITLERIRRLHILMEKNWLLHQELEKKKEVEELNKQLEKKIRNQTILYNIIDSLSKINRSENLYQYLVNKALESCNAEKACFMLYDEGNHSLLSLAQGGLPNFHPGLQIELTKEVDTSQLFCTDLFEPREDTPGRKTISLNKIVRANRFMSVPFKIRSEPFGVLLIGEKEGQRKFDSEDEFILSFLAEKAALTIENIALYDNLKQSLLASLMSLVSAIEAKDAYTQQHSTRVTEYALKVASKMGCQHDDLQRLRSSSPLHDIGKIGIQDSILNKPARLTKEEFEHIKAHPTIGVNIVSPLGLDLEELAIIRSHHERWDGKGYPDGLKKDRTPRLARILAVADAFDAMKSNRAYRDALPLSVCLQEIKDNRGGQFDPDVVDAALSVLSEEH